MHRVRLARDSSGMSDVAVIGLGAMGGALADAMLSAGHDLTVWNRTPGRSERFRDSGACCAATLADAVKSSKTVLVCVSDYAASRTLFDEPAAQQALAGRTLIQVSTGTPQEARDAAQWAQALNADYLDGAILAYPAEIGEAALIAVSGNESVWRQQESLLAALSSDVRYLGAAIGAAAALDVAVLSYYVCSHLGLVHGALICESENLRPDLLAGVIADSLPSDTEEIRKLGSALQQKEFTGADASLEVYGGVIDRILTQANDASINTEIPTFARSIYRKGLQAGLADEEVVALVKVLRNA